MRQNSRLDKCGIPEDELLKRQQELFEKVSSYTYSNHLSFTPWTSEKKVISSSTLVTLWTFEKILILLDFEKNLLVPWTIEKLCRSTTQWKLIFFFQARLEQAEQEQNQLAWFQKQIELAQQVRQENGTSAAAADTTPSPINKYPPPTSSSSSSCNQTSVIVDLKSSTTSQQKPVFDRLELDEDYDAPE